MGDDGFSVRRNFDQTTGEARLTGLRERPPSGEQVDVYAVYIHDGIEKGSASMRDKPRRASLGPFAFIPFLSPNMTIK